MGLSSDIIWHQTDFNGLKAILSSQHFICSYSLEDIKWKNTNIQRAFPMISFCNIPISDLYEYLKDNKDNKFTGKYGKYTIGLKHSWCIRCGLAPVWYLNQQSNILHEVMQYHTKLQAKNWDSFSINIWALMSYIKNYEGNLDKYGFKSYRFYDEREIRYVPNISKLEDNGISPMLTEKEYKEYKSSHGKSALIKDLSISFEMTDISYILVSCASKKNKIINLFGGHNNDITILSYEQVIKSIIGLSHNRK